MQETPQKDRHVLRIIFIEGAANLVVLGAKLAVGISTGSLAIIGDAIHSFTDVLNNGVAWLVVKHSSAPPDAEHPYGHRKFETLAVFGLATLLAVFAFELAFQAIRREDSVVTTGGWELLLMLAVLVINVVLSAWQRFWARKLNSDILLADASHTFADVLTSTVVIIGWQLSAMGYQWLDQLCALGVSGLVLYLAFTLFRRALPALTDMSSIDSEALIATAEAVTGAGTVRRVRSRWIGSERAVDMIISVDAHLPIAQAHALADQIEDRLEAHYGLRDISIHMEPSSEVRL